MSRLTDKEVSMGVLIPLALVVFVLASRSNKAAAPATGGSADVSAECGPYPPIVNGWRPICLGRTEPGPRPTSAMVGQRVILWVQEGRRALADETNMAVVEGLVVAQNVGGSQPLYAIRVTRVIQTFHMQPGVAPIAVGTLFGNVRPQFIDTFNIASIDALYPRTPVPGTMPAGPPPPAGRIPPGAPGGPPPLPIGFDTWTPEEKAAWLAANPGSASVAGWYGSSVGACGPQYGYPMVGYRYGYGYPRAA